MAEALGGIRQKLSRVAEIRLYVKNNLARYKVPRDVVFIDELPRNVTGKLLRRVLTEMDVDS
jgi:fatty-acyl-CoA synthase